MRVRSHIVNDGNYRTCCASKEKVILLRVFSKIKRHFKNNNVMPQFLSASEVADEDAKGMLKLCSLGEGGGCNNCGKFWPENCSQK